MITWLLYQSIEILTTLSLYWNPENYLEIRDSYLPVKILERLGQQIGVVTNEFFALHPDSSNHRRVFGMGSSPPRTSSWSSVRMSKIFRRLWPEHGHVRNEDTHRKRLIANLNILLLKNYVEIVCFHVQNWILKTK